MPRGTSHELMRTRARLAREGGTRVCGICTGAVDMELPTGHPHAFELDHVIPRKYGGPDSLANIRVVHRSCNRSRGAGDGGRRAGPSTPSNLSDKW
jgi:5-methylcytosine-specific restriction endonuclease McrA